VKKISRVPCGKPKLSVSEKTDAMGHLTRYLLKKAFQLFCFYPSLPKGRARLETVFDVGLQQNGAIVHFYCEMESKFNRL
jgi:hypothetical protein